MIDPSQLAELANAVPALTQAMKDGPAFALQLSNSAAWFEEAAANQVDTSEKLMAAAQAFAAAKGASRAGVPVERDEDARDANIGHPPRFGDVPPNFAQFATSLSAATLGLANVARQFEEAATDQKESANAMAEAAKAFANANTPAPQEEPKREAIHRARHGFANSRAGKLLNKYSGGTFGKASQGLRRASISGRRMGRKTGRVFARASKQLNRRGARLIRQGNKFGKMRAPKGLGSVQKMAKIGGMRASGLATKLAGGALKGAGAAVGGMPAAAASFAAIGSSATLAAVAMTGLVTAGYAAAEAIESHGRKLLEAQRQLAAISPQHASIFQQDNLRNMQRMRETARTTGWSTAMQADSLNDLTDAMQGWKDLKTNVANLTSIIENRLTEALTGFFDPLWKKSNEWLEGIFGNTAPQSPTASLSEFVQAQAERNQRDRRNGMLHKRNPELGSSATAGGDY